MPEYARECQSIPESCQSMPKSSPSCPKVVTKMSPSRHQWCPAEPIRNPWSQQMESSGSDCLYIALWPLYSSIGSESESPVLRTVVIWKSGCWWVSSRSGWLLELLTELIKMIKDKERRNCPPWRVARSINLKKIKRKRIAHLDTCQVNEDDIIKERKELH